MYSSYSFQDHVKSGILNIPVLARWQEKESVKLFLKVEKLKANTFKFTCFRS